MVFGSKLIYAIYINFYINVFVTIYIYETKSQIGFAAKFFKTTSISMFFETFSISILMVINHLVDNWIFAFKILWSKCFCVVFFIFVVFYQFQGVSYLFCNYFGLKLSIYSSNLWHYNKMFKNKIKVKNNSIQT